MGQNNGKTFWILEKALKSVVSLENKNPKISND